MYASAGSDAMGSFVGEYHKEQGKRRRGIRVGGTRTPPRLEVASNPVI